MNIKLIAVCVAVATLSVVSTRPVAAMSCSQWLNYRMGDTDAHVQKIGFGLMTFLEGYVEAVNAFDERIRGNVVSGISPGKVVPPPQGMVLKAAVAGLDRHCAANPSQSAITVGKNEMQTEMHRVAAPIAASMQTVLRNKNEAKGNK